MRIKHDTQWLAGSAFETHSELRIVGQHCANAGDNGRTARTQALHVFTCRSTGDPLTLARGHRGSPIETHRQLAANEGTSLAHAYYKAGIERLRLGYKEAARHLD